jgi:hypothetical protein
MMQLQKMEAETIKAMTAVDRLMKKEKTDSISDLHTVDEDQEDEQNEISSKQEAREYVESEVLGDLLMKEIGKMAQGSVKVHWFMLMCVHRRRFKRKQAAITKIQCMFRVSLAKREMSKRKIDKLGVKKVRQMTTFLKYHSDPELLHDSARVIHKKLYLRIVKKKQAKELRKKMKELPYVCRNGFLKMQLLKADTASLSTKTTRIFSSMGRRPKD